MTFDEAMVLPLDGVEAKVTKTELPDGSVQVEVAWDADDGPVGQMTVRQSDDEWYFGGLYVHEGWRNKGLNTHLHGPMKQVATELGVRQWRMAPADEPSAAAFAKFGWVRDGMFMRLEL